METMRVRDDERKHGRTKDEESGMEGGGWGSCLHRGPLDVKSPFQH